MKKYKNKSMGISSILEEIQQLNKMIELHKNHSDDDFMTSQYEYKKYKLYDELLPLFLDRIKEFLTVKKTSLPKDLEYNLKQMEEIFI